MQAVKWAAKAVEERIRETEEELVIVSTSSCRLASRGCLRRLWRCTRSRCWVLGRALRCVFPDDLTITYCNDHRETHKATTLLTLI